MLEDLRLKAYPDNGGIWTVGYGHTGKDVYHGLVITKEIAGMLLSRDVAASERAVNLGLKRDVTPRQFDALVILAFNIGAAGFLGSSILRDINSGNIPAEEADWMKWNKVKVRGRLEASAGLTHRRQAEWRIFSEA